MAGGIRLVVAGQNARGPRSFPYDESMSDPRPETNLADPCFPTGWRARRWGVLALLGVALLLHGSALCRAEEPLGGSRTSEGAAREAPQGAPLDHLVPAEAEERPAPAPGMRGAPAREQFLQHALGTQGDVRVPAVLLSLAALLAVVAVAWRRAGARQRGEPGEGDDLPEIEGRDDLGQDPAP